MNKTEVSELRAKTFFLDEANIKANNTHRLVCLAAGIDCIEKVPKCVCGNYAQFNKTIHKDGFRQFCSVECSRKNKTVSPFAKERLNDIVWLTEQRVTKRRSHVSIGEELGVSEEPVRDALKKFSIEKIDAKVKNASALAVRNKDVLTDLYVNQKLTCEQIAELLGSSKPTVSIWLNEFGIETRTSADYEQTAHPSGECLEVIDFIRSFYTDEIIIDQYILPGFFGGKQLDIYLPKAKFAIEYSGLFHHVHRPYEDSLPKIKGPTYHKGKAIECQFMGVTLFTLWSDQWRNHKEAVKSLIKHKLGYSTNKIYARKLSVEVCTASQKTDFLNQTHIQGSCPSKFKYSLKDKSGEIYAVMTFSPARYQTGKSDFDWELVRFACKNNWSVVGGFSRLLHHFRKDHPGSIVSYSDSCYSKGDVYKKNGFVLQGYNPNYWFVDTNNDIRYSRHRFQRKAIAKEGDVRTGLEIVMEDFKLKVLHGCGTKTWVLK